jgi:hydrogenase-4 component B
MSGKPVEINRGGYAHQQLTAPNPAGSDNLPSVSDLILLFLAMDTAILLLLGIFVAILPVLARGFLLTAFSGLGMLLCLPPLLMRTPAAAIDLRIGPPGLSLHLALDSLSACFLACVFLAGTAIAAFQATSVPRTGIAPVRITAFCLAGSALALLAADGVTLAIGLAFSRGAIWLPHTAPPQTAGRQTIPLQTAPSPIAPPQTTWHDRATLLIPALLLAAVCLLTPPGFAPHFDAIRAAPVDPDHAAAAAALTIAAVAGLTWSRSLQRRGTRDALNAGMLIPFGSYLLLRLIADLSGQAAQTGWGFAMILAGGTAAVIQGWRAAKHPDLNGSVACLMRRQAALAMTGVGLALIARAADLPGAASFALAATFLLAISGSLAGVLTSLAVHAIASSAGTQRLYRLGGLVHAMPATSVALATGLLGLSAVPPGVGFASLWLLFEAILSAPRTGGLLFQLPLALMAAALALSAALATAGSVRLIGIALLGRPRTPQGAGARETRSPSRTILMVLAGLSAMAGVLPGLVLWVLAEPAIHALVGASRSTRVGLALLVPSIASPSYLALPVLALLVLATVVAMQVPRWSPGESKVIGLWADGMEPPFGLPFGEPAAQSVGEGFLPALPDLPKPRPLPAFATPRPPSAAVGLWLILAAFGALLLVLAVIG